jgi:hypothetical protein
LQSRCGSGLACGSRLRSAVCGLRSKRRPTATASMPSVRISLVLALEPQTADLRPRTVIVGDDAPAPRRGNQRPCTSRISSSNCRSSGPSAAA